MPLAFAFAKREYTVEIPLGAVDAYSSVATVRDGHWHWGLGDPDFGAVLVTGLYLLVAMACGVAAQRVGAKRITARTQRDGEASGPPHAADQLLSESSASIFFIGNGAEDESQGPPHPTFGHLLPLEGEKDESLLSDDDVAERQAWWVLAGMMFCLGINKQADLQSLLSLYGREILRDLGLYDVRRIIQVVFILGVLLAAAMIATLALWAARRWSWSCRFAAVGLALQAAFVVIRAASFHHVDTLLGMRLGDLKFNLLLESVGLTVMLLAALSSWRKARVCQNEGHKDSSHNG